MASKQSTRKSTQNSGIDRRKQNKGRIENLQPFKSRADNGGELDPRINVGGRPKLISNAYQKMLASQFPRELIDAMPNLKMQIRYYTEDENAEITYADKIALSQGMAAATGDTAAAREIRSATESEQIEINDASLTDDERIIRIATILERARARRNGQSDTESAA